MQIPRQILLALYLYKKHLSWELLKLPSKFYDTEHENFVQFISKVKNEQNVTLSSYTYT